MRAREEDDEDEEEEEEEEETDDATTRGTPVTTSHAYARVIRTKMKLKRPKGESEKEEKKEKEARTSRARAREDGDGRGRASANATKRANEERELTYDEQFPHEKARERLGRGRETVFGTNYRAPPAVLHGYDETWANKRNLTREESLDLRAACKADKFCK